MRIILTILSILLLVSCDPTKQVLKHQDQFETVGRAWSKLHPCVNDSTTQVIKGGIDSVAPTAPIVDNVKIKQIRDSIVKVLAKKYDSNLQDCSQQVNDAFDEGYAQANDEWMQKKILIPRPDTFKTVVKDKRAEDVLTADNAALKNTVVDITNKCSKVKDQRNYAYMGIGLLLLIMIGSVIAIIKKKA